jgi:hypothetical protein
LKIHFDREVDLRHVQVALAPPAAVTLKAVGKQDITIVPMQAWEPARRYRVALGEVPNSAHAASLTGWRAEFTTQPHVGIAGFKVDGQPVSGEADATPYSKVNAAFTVPMTEATVKFNVNGKPLPATSLAWAKEANSLDLTLPPAPPYQRVEIELAAGGRSKEGDPVTDSSRLALNPLPLEPSNVSSGIGAGFKTRTPIQVVVENSGPARPQVGLQGADIVYEYISEYSISRMTAVYFNNIPGLIGPVRSCRMINPYLDFAYRADFMCSGASVGTLHYMFGDGGVLPLVPGTINDFDSGNHFFRVGFKAAPHNLYTSGDRAERLRGEMTPPPPRLVVDPPHPDVEAGQPADPPVVGLHAVNYAYDPGSRQYLRFDHGSPFTENGGPQLAVKNIVLLHVPFHDAGWVEDENGGAHCVWYDMLGSGPVEIYSDGKLIHGQWHMGNGQGWYFQNDQAPYYTDDQGNVIRLNSGLTWIHVLGNGQTF